MNWNVDGTLIDWDADNWGQEGEVWPCSTIFLWLGEGWLD